MSTAAAEKKEQGLAKPESTPDRITTSAQYQDALKRWKDEQGAHVISPYAAFTGLAEGFALVATKIYINLEKASEEVWDGDSSLPWLKGTNKCSLAKVGLRRIAECGSYSTDTEDLTDYRIPYFWRVKAFISWRGLDGTTITRTAMKTWDCREPQAGLPDGGADIRNFTRNQILENRKHGLRHCESRAVNAVIREIGLKQTYTKEELKKPFIVVKAMFQPNMKDPIQAQAVVEANLRGTSALYRGQRPAMGATADIIDHQPTQPDLVHVGSGSTTPQQNGQPLTSVPPEGYGLIKDLRVEELKRRSDGNKFPKWVVVDHNGVESVTIKREFGDLLERLWNGGKPSTPVEILSTENNYQDLEITAVNVLGAVKQQGLPDLGNI